MQIQIPMPRTIHSVSEITNTLSSVIRQDPRFQNVWVQGQVSNLSRVAPGHTYFTLKDANSQIGGALFRRDAARLRFLPRDGDEVLVRGTINIYSPRSEYQIVAKAVEPLGVGALQRAFEELKHRLAAEGLFDDIHKKRLPQFPQKIGVVTSAAGAAIQDIRQQLQKRYPLARLLLHPTLVQGNGAAQQIAHAIRHMNWRADIDVLIVGRGGGSIEDLWPFNEESVARAIFDSVIPVVSAVGHETDFTIADMVADHRAPTPSAAIEHIVPDQGELLARLQEFDGQLCRMAPQRLKTLRTELAALETRLAPTRRRDAIHELHQTVDNLEAACRAEAERRLADSERELHALAQRLNALSPLATLKRGYSISRKTDGQVVTAAEQVSVGERIELQLSQGNLVCRVEERTEEGFDQNHLKKK